jgi:signal transduction histidine kinase
MHALVNGSKVQVAANPSPFQRLQAQARRLQWLAVCLVGSVAVVPALVYFTLALSNLRLDAERHARHLVPMIASSVYGSDLDRETISALIGREMAFNDLAGVRLLDAAGVEILRLGRGDSSFSATEVAIHLPASTGPVRELRVTPDDRALLDRAARVLGLHLLVAAVLGALVYRVPMRALWHAIDEVERTQAQLVHSDRLSSIGEMYAGLAHEINNPLGIILTRVRFLLATAAERQLPPDLVQDLEVIDRHGSRIAETIRGLLAFARRTEFEFAPTDVNGVIGEAVALVEPLFARQGIGLQLFLDRSLPRVRASAQHLQQVFLNLVNNAHDAMPDGGTITLRTYRNGSSLVAEVRDTGRGIPPEIQPRVFEPFFTTKDVGKGTGLGLAVSYGIVRAHGGDLTVESRQGDGAVFRVVLPGEVTRW